MGQSGTKLQGYFGMRGTMKLIATLSTLLLGVTMAAASDPGTTKASSSAAPNTKKSVEKTSAPASSTPAAGVENAQKTAKTASLGKPTKKKPQVGPASWYGAKFQGKTTASGEPYDMYQFTAAHREAPLGSWLKVTNLRTGKWLIVKVNDRGPWVGNRIVDLSSSAADMLGIKGRGVERVKLEVIEPAVVATTAPWSVGLEPLD
jgi:rare lipoprotein A